VLVFLFFMITDPKTIPAGNVARVAFGVLVAVASTLLMAPQTNEFGTKVGLLAGLVVVCALRPIVERLLPEPRSAADDVWGFATRIAVHGSARGGSVGRAARLGLIGAVVLALGAGIVAAGTPARGLVAPDLAEALDGVPRQVDPNTFPPISVDQEVLDFDHTLAGPEAQQILLTLAENLELENQALLRADGSILLAVDHGDRLAEMQRQLDSRETTGQTVITHYQFDAVRVVLIVPFGVQTGVSLGFESRGTQVQETYDASGALRDRQASPFSLTFAVRRATGARWLNVAVLPPGDGG
jgi:hypothetical protein